MCLGTMPRVRLHPQESLAVQVFLTPAGVLLCVYTGITHQSWSTGTQEMPKPTLQTPRAKAYKLVSPLVSRICVSWRARSLRSTATWPWLLNPYLHQDRGGFKAGLSLQALNKTCKKHKADIYGLCSFAQHIQPKATTAPTKDMGPPKYAPSLRVGRLWDLTEQLPSDLTC